MSCASKHVEETIGESSKTFEEHEPMSASHEPSPDLSSFQSPEDTEVCMPTPKCCTNCSTLKKENRKLKSQCVTLRESSKKRRAEIRKLRKKGNNPFECHKNVSSIQTQIILYLLILVEKLEGILKVKDSSLDVEFETRTGVPEEPMEALSEDEDDDHEMEEEDNDEGSVYQTETETTESEIEGDLEQEIG